MGRDDFGNLIVVGLNHQYIQDWVCNKGDGNYLDILEAVLTKPSDIQGFWHPDRVITASREGTLLLVVQLCLTALNLHPVSNNVGKGLNSPKSIPHYDCAQIEVYADHEKQPLFLGKWKQEMNVRLALNIVHFFKFHLKAPSSEGILSELYRSLEPNQLPQPWLGKLQKGTQKLGANWKGTFSRYPSQIRRSFS
jgi:hypothetical protein